MDRSPFFVFNIGVTSFENHPQWAAIKKIHQTLVSEGYRTLIAGGAVRDLLLGRTPQDIDIATKATPEQVEQLFEKTVMVGKEFGVARVIIDGCDVEVATFRKDGPYSDGRKPDSVEYSDEKEDAERRDFTINAMFYDLENKEVIDFVGGQKDLMRKVLRTVGDPEKRFEEDKLRILRAVRFHAQLGFTIDSTTAESIRKHSIQIHQVSMERIRDEWQKIMLAENALSGIQRTYDLALWAPLFGSWKFQSDEYKKHFSIPTADIDKLWILWFLIHCQESSEKIAELGMHWKLPKKRIQSAVYCLQSLSQLRNIQNVEPVDLAIFLSKPNGRLAIEIYQMLHQGRIKDHFFDKFKAAETFFNQGRLPELLVNGDDLIGYGVAPGPDIAKQMKKLYRIQLQENITHKEDLMKKIEH